MDSIQSVRRRIKYDQAEPNVSKNNSSGKPAVPNEISDDTGQYDIRFLLWRQFCAENGLPVATMPSDLEGDIGDKWEQLKEERLHRKSRKR